MGEWEGEVAESLKRIADALEQLVEQGRILKDSKAIATVLRAEDQQFTKETIEISEEVLMDLTEVTVMVCTEKAVLVTKKGYQKWIPISTIEDCDNSKINEGDFLTDIVLTEKGSKWIPNKSWDKLKVVKK